MDCNSIKDLIALKISGELNNDQSEKLEQHLSQCSECKSYYKFQTSLLSTNRDSNYNLDSLNKVVLKKVSKQTNLYKIGYYSISVAASILLIVFIINNRNRSEIESLSGGDIFSLSQDGENYAMVIDFIGDGESSENGDIYNLYDDDYSF